MKQENDNEKLEESNSDISNLSINEQIKEIFQIMKDSQTEVEETSKILNLKKESSQNK